MTDFRVPGPGGVPPLWEAGNRGFRSPWEASRAARGGAGAGAQTRAGC